MDKLGTRFFASALDDEDSAVFPLAVARGESDLWVQGTVRDVDADEFSIDTFSRAVRVEVAELPYDPLDAEGYQRIGAGDIVEIDKRGRRFHALVTQLEQLESGRFELLVRPLDSRISWRTATVREVVEVWRRAGR